MTICRRCGIELRQSPRPLGVGWGHVAPTAYRHYPRPTSDPAPVLRVPALVQEQGRRPDRSRARDGRRLKLERARGRVE